MALQRTQSLTTTKIAKGSAAGHIGMKGELTVSDSLKDDNTVDLRLHDGITEGGVLLDSYEVKEGWAKAQEAADQNSGPPPAPPISVEFLAIGGGAGGGGGGGGNQGGGGGAGGLITIEDLSLLVDGNYNIQIGEAGTGNSAGAGNNGYDTSFVLNDEITFIAKGGGGGGGNGVMPSSGGSGGGIKRDGYLSSHVPGVSNQQVDFGEYVGVGFGNAGGPIVGYSSNGYHCSSGGGGAGAVGGHTGDDDVQSGWDDATMRHGGAGKMIAITGQEYYWAAGGAGVTWKTSAGVGGIGGGGGGCGLVLGGGAGGGSALNAGTSGSDTIGGNGGANTGSGGGGGNDAGGGGNGGSGIVIIAYPIAHPELTVSGFTLGTTYTYSDSSRSGYRVYQFLSGSGSISFS